MQETPVHLLGWEDPLEEGMAIPLQSSCLENTHGQRNLVGCSPWGHKGSDTTERLGMHAWLSNIALYICIISSLSIPSKIEKTESMGQ